MDHQKKISLIMPVHNAAEYLDISIGSVLKQTVGIDDVEMIIVDDHSDDERTVKRLKEYESAFPDNIILILNSENMGPGGCRNVAMGYATGEYVMFLDSDDRLDEDAFECLYDIAKQHDADVVEFGFVRETSAVYGVKRSDRRKNEIVYSYTISSGEERQGFVLPSDSSVVCWDKMYRTGLLRENDIVFAERISYEEPPFSYMVRFFCKKYLKISEAFYHYYKREGSCSDIENYKKNRFHIVEGYLKLHEEFVKRGLDKRYKEEMEYIFWCGAFYLPLFNMAAANTFYDEKEFYDLQRCVKEIVEDITQNRYFRRDFKDLGIIGKLTYVPEYKVPFEDIRELFFKIAGT
ncbi:MAG: glycosyltransferase [Lachnospiraceae bacterium]|nr:glycosyltransferase [Lachnospiraceae bacterium]